MKEERRNTNDVLDDIKKLVNTPGYIYPLLLIIFEDFHINPEKLHEINYRERLNMNEASLLIGFLVQNSIDLTIPLSFEFVFEAKKKTYSLMKELHGTFHNSFIDNLKHEMESGEKPKSFQDFFSQSDMLLEPIFYAGTGVYDFQYLDFLSKKYEYDEEWLRVNRGFIFSEAITIFKEIKSIQQEKSQKVNLYVARNLDEVKKEARKSYKGKNFETDFQQMADMAQLHQYAELFFDDSIRGLDIDSEEFRNASHKAFYKNLIDLFCIKKSKLEKMNGGSSFIDNFSIKSGDPLCSRFTGIGAYNASSSHPLIELDEERFLLPMSFILSEAIYEAPFYWMYGDSAYRDISATNRGNAGENIVFQFLEKVFQNKAYRRVLVKTGKNHIETDIDILCVLGSKALCVQVKSKKLTELSRKGNIEALQRDFQGAVQDAYEQAWIAREKILDKSSSFFDENGDEIILSEGIDEVYMLAVTTENYPSLTHQSSTLLKLKNNSPYPLAFTIFDLEMVTHYLNDPYDLLYYIRQRINLINYFRGDEEISFLSHHLTHKLWKDPESDFCLLDQSFAQAIDRNYYPLKAGLLVSDEGDTIKTRWKDEKFNVLCRQLKTIAEDKVTDIIFHLYDLSGNARTQLVSLMQDRKRKTWEDNQFHSVSIPPDESFEDRFGITYFSSETNSLEEVEKRLFVLSSLRKYKSKANTWLGLGSIKNSKAPFDLVLYDYKPWEYDVSLEESSKHLPDLVRTSYINLNNSSKTRKKVGRNEKCPCGSGKKYKKCCLNDSR